MNSLISPYRQSYHSLDAKDKLSQQQINSFKNAQFQTVELQAGMVLWRFHREPYRFSDCWIDGPTMEVVMRSFQAGGIYDLRQIQETIRNNLAILFEWNQINNRVKIVLKQKIIAHVGTIGVQSVHQNHRAVDQSRFQAFYKDLRPEEKVSKQIEQRLGGLTQYVVPRLRDRNLNQNCNEYAETSVHPLSKHMSPHSRMKSWGRNMDQKRKRF